MERLVVVAEIDRHYSAENVESIPEAIREAVSVNHELSANAICLIKQTTIPKTSSGKIQRHLCREQYLAGELKLLNP